MKGYIAIAQPIEGSLPYVEHLQHILSADDPVYKVDKAYQALRRKRALEAQVVVHKRHTKRYEWLEEEASRAKLHQNLKDIITASLLGSQKSYLDKAKEPVAQAAALAVVALFRIEPSPTESGLRDRSERKQEALGGSRSFAGTFRASQSKFGGRAYRA